MLYQPDIKCPHVDATYLELRFSDSCFLIIVSLLKAFASATRIQLLHRWEAEVL